MNHYVMQDKLDIPVLMNDLVPDELLAVVRVMDHSLYFHYDSDYPNTNYKLLLLFFVQMGSQDTQDIQQLMMNILHCYLKVQLMMLNCYYQQLLVYFGMMLIL